jgi:hypothetical protein
MGESHLKDVSTAEERLEMNDSRTQCMRVCGCLQPFFK